jgi:hypothetical protein
VVCCKCSIHAGFNGLFDCHRSAKHAEQEPHTLGLFFVFS